MCKAEQEIREAGGTVVAVGRTSVEQARRLEQRHVPYPCLVDPHGQVYRALGLHRFRLGDLVSPRRMGIFVESTVLGMARGVMQGRVSTTPQLPGVAVLDADRRLVYLHRGEAIGHYPPLEDVLAALRMAAAR